MEYKTQEINLRKENKPEIRSALSQTFLYVENYIDFKKCETKKMWEEKCFAIIIFAGIKYKSLISRKENKFFPQIIS